MSSASSMVTYTSVYTDSEPGIVFWGANEELSNGGSPLVVVYGYDGLPMQSIAPPSPDYIPGPEEPQAPLPPDFVPEPEYPEFLVSSDAEAPMEEQPYAADASPTALSPGYVTDSDLEEDPEEEHVDYPADGGDDDDKPSDEDDDNDNDDGDADDEDKETSEDEEEEEEHLAPADPSTVPVVDPVPSAGDIEAVEAEEPAPTSPRTRVPFSQTRLHSSPPLPPLPSSPLPPLPPSLFIPPVYRKEDILEDELPPRKRLYSTAPTLRYGVGESSTAAPRPIGGHRVDYGFIGTLDAKARRQRAEVSVEALVDDRQYHYRTAQLLDQEALVSQEAWAHSVGLSSAAHYELQGYKTHTWMQDHRIDAHESLIATLVAQVSSLQGHLATALGEIRALQARDQTRTDAPEGAASMNNMPPKRTSAAARTAAAASMTAAAVEQLIAERVYAALANHETLRNNTNGHGDGSHNSGTGIRGTTRTPHELFHISNCVVENQVKFATCTFIGNALTWWNSHMKVVTHDVAYAMRWKTLKKMMTVKYCPRGEIKKLEVELWNLKVKGTDIASYTLCFQELTLMYGRMFHGESYEVERYVGGLPDMIRGNVMSYQPKTMEKAIEFANDQMDQKVLTITERQAEQKRKLEFNAGNNQGYQQQNKRQNTGRAYTARSGEKREYTGSLPLCTKYNYHHKGPCAPRCNKCKKIGHLASNCRSSGPNNNNNNRGNSGATKNAVTCYECGVQGYYKKDCPKLKNGNRGNQRGNGNAPAKVYVVGNAGTNLDSNVVMGTFLLNDRYASILFDTGADRSC
ncbi:reverse transcriptase domain-containing protein [Tanacetum coccineum]|uniref:Reverse transcriptase domain-containing protein n=1 Tax=Tanacetum coccineum TaxID=301880 RepID=A0ABQ5DH75_9ASTR